MATRNGITAEIYKVLAQLQDSYENLITIIGGIAQTQAEHGRKIEEIKTFIAEEVVDVATARNVWRENAERHKAEAERLTELLKQYEAGAVLTGNGHE